MDKKRLPVLCDSDSCMGCSSCAQACPRDAIEMNFNSEGFYNPFVNPDKCIRCLRCEKSCHILNPIQNNRIAPKAYVAWHKDSNVRYDSSSGGVFSSFAEVVLRQGGVIWGQALMRVWFLHTNVLSRRIACAIFVVQNIFKYMSVILLSKFKTNLYPEEKYYFVVLLVMLQVFMHI